MYFLSLLISLAAIFATPAPSTTATASTARFYALRLLPGQDPKVELERFAAVQKLRAGYIASCVGSLSCISLRFANMPNPEIREGHYEVVSLSGTLSGSGMHLHASVSDSTGATLGGHLADGSRVYTTLEVVIGELDRLAFDRMVDTTYGYPELVVKKR